jgi:hypothetical protein
MTSEKSNPSSSMRGVCLAQNIASSLIWVLCIAISLYLLYIIMGYFGIPELLSLIALILIGVASITLIIVNALKFKCEG